jgi:hypothetical protein
MKTPARILAVLLSSAVAGTALADGLNQAPSPAFERLKTLAGDWTGTAGTGPKAQATRATIRVVSAGSAVMITTDPGTAHEMVTLVHRDGDALVATHYCAAQNQPRMRAVPGVDPVRIAFEFVDGTNLGSFPARMQRLVIATPSPDRQIQEWTFRDGAKDSTDVFDLSRVR